MSEEYDLCLCGEINGRHCPVHGEGEVMADTATTLRESVCLAISKLSEIADKHFRYEEVNQIEREIDGVRHHLEGTLIGIDEPNGPLATSADSFDEQCMKAGFDPLEDDGICRRLSPTDEMLAIAKAFEGFSSNSVDAMTKMMKERDAYRDRAQEMENKYIERCREADVYRKALEAADCWCIFGADNRCLRCKALAQYEVGRKP